MSTTRKRRSRNLRVVSFKRREDLTKQPGDIEDLTDLEWGLIDQFRSLSAGDNYATRAELLRWDEARLIENYRTLTHDRRIYYEAAIAGQVYHNARNALARAHELPRGKQ